MKFSHLLLAAGLCSFSVAQAQTAPRNSTTLTPSSAAPALNPNSASSRDLPPTGAPDAIDNTIETKGASTKGKKMHASKHSQTVKEKTKM